MELERRAIQRGMHVFGADGKRIGRIEWCGDRGFIVRRGVLRPRRYVAPYEDVWALHRLGVTLAKPRGAMVPSASLAEVGGPPLMSVRPIAH